jgi:hypothetical protein
MELLSVAQKYKADVVLTRIRNYIAQQDPPLIREDTALYVYSLAHKYELRTEALQAARLTLTFSPFTIEGLKDKLDMMSGVCLNELRKYHETVKSNIFFGLEEDRKSHAQILGEPTCQSLRYSDIPVWLHEYCEAMGEDPALFDLTRFHMALSNHVQPPESGGSGGCVSCACISHKAIQALWTSLTAVVNGSITKVSWYNCID